METWFVWHTDVYCVYFLALGSLYADSIFETVDIYLPQDMKQETKLPVRIFFLHRPQTKTISHTSLLTLVLALGGLPGTVLKKLLDGVRLWSAAVESFASFVCAFSGICSGPLPSSISITAAVSTLNGSALSHLIPCSGLGFPPRVHALYRQAPRCHMEQM
jgi:hypothetical protein